jgi:hypothetical protein
VRVACHWQRILHKLNTKQHSPTTFLVFTDLVLLLIMHGKLPEIPGLKADGDLLLSFRREVANLLRRPNTNFPGAQPVSFARKHLTDLCQQEYA